ncbi:MAG TPA: MiaB/RimO family radical SAM methylthiotransferase [Candidatus Woesebacteria bacterium]|jgi:tRNA-2-methylthio-N6-dimethylallyladenosine synthase|nr:MiaB/RimO family radical SAM methylthiotransferase [Candidatus Woesebacteria bacterium]HOA11735.1 MiaB/RimO family radical SAM methylthiotransferase [Candidatus Woesebacteria bacterium]HOC07641.1 MiaB/RimO family radical SAM methylthiotransferase [Candidatus Woesebacteria bacterium]HOP38791.1 MiaB/RimO family radical SAM methylthiotransferase [Candidatus Woesebacteria bacterium]HPA61736.1 MiaB/RimO family radical SAM methylthiotransferase [Candidatus Woesebacteria bacterium]
MSKKYFIKTYGCQANKSDAERMAALFEEEGLIASDSWQDCDKLAVVTCSVRERAEQRVRAFLLKVAKFYQDKKLTKPEIIFSGCMIHHGQEHLKKILPMIDQIVPTNQMAFLKKAKRQDKLHAFVPISVGCNSYCTYCIVPYARGREKSRPFSDIMEEVNGLVKEGYQEITLIGQNVNSWGLEKIGVANRKMELHSALKRESLPSNQSQYLTPSGTPPFVELIRAISQFDEIKTLRFMSSNPWDFHDQLIEEIANNHKLDRFIHLPVQSGSDSVLYRMNRGYTREDYLNIIKKLRQAAPDVVLGTDIIVGFPGETEEEFADTVDLAKKVNWHLAFVNIYSPRPGTSANQLYRDDVPYAIKKRRWQILDELINKKNLKQRPKVV